MSKIIAVEGAECSGKSFLIRALSEQIIKNGKSVLIIDKKSLIDYKLKVMLHELGAELDDFESFILMFLRFNRKSDEIKKNHSMYDYIILDRYDISIQLYSKIKNVDIKLLQTMSENVGIMPVDLYIITKADYSLIASTLENRYHELPFVISEEMYTYKSSYFDKAATNLRTMKILNFNYDIKEIYKQICTNMF